MEGIIWNLIVPLAFGVLIVWTLFRIRDTLLKLQVWKDYREPIIRWSTQVNQKLSEAVALCEEDPEGAGDDFRISRNRLEWELSSQIDEGSIVLPNEYSNLYGPEKQGPFKGYNPPALDCIKAAHSIIGAITHTAFEHNKHPAADASHSQVVEIKAALAQLNDEPLVCYEEGLGDFEGWSCQRALLVCKRKFINEVHELVDIEDWVQQLKRFTPIKGKTAG